MDGGGTVSTPEETRPERGGGAAAGVAAPTSILPAPSPLEAAAIVAAIERFARDTAQAPPRTPAVSGGWLRAARAEAVSRTPRRSAGSADWHPWIGGPQQRPS